MEDFLETNENGQQKISGIFKCYQCEFKCGTSEDLKEHYQIHRTEFPFKCFQCGYNGKNAEDFKAHSVTHFEQSYYKCPKCDYKDKFKQNITRHVRYTHKNMCNCGLQFNLKHEFTQHLANNPECKEDIELYEDVGELEDAVTKYLVKNATKVDYLTEATGISLQADDNSSAESKSNQVFVCQVCFYIFRSAEMLEEHTVLAHSHNHSTLTATEESEGNSDSEMTVDQLNQNSNFFLCGACHFIFSSRADLDEHLLTHENRQVDGVLDDAAYSAIAEMEEGSAEEVDYVCYICDKAFGSEKAVKLHMGHHAAIKFRCPKCGISLKSQASLKSHLASHPPLKAGKKNDFSNKKSNSENLYKCASCPYQTNFHDNLQMHLMTHSKRDPSKRKIKPTFKVRFSKK